MKKLLLLVLLLPLTGFGQRTFVRAGYLGHFGYQVGITAAYEHGLRSWEKIIKKERTRTTNFYVGSNLGWYSRVGYNSNLLVGPETGLITQKDGKRFYHNYFLSANYLMQAEVVYRSVDNSGKVVHVERQNRHYVLPLVGYGFGQLFENGFGWQFRLSGGMKFTGQYENSGMLFTEVLLRYQLNRK